MFRDTETADTETADTETADTETADTETADTETAETETADTEARMVAFDTAAYERIATRARLRGRSADAEPDVGVRLHRRWWWSRVAVPHSGWLQKGNGVILRSRAALLAVLVAGTILATAGPAPAHQADIEDAGGRGDVFEMVFDAETSTFDFVEAGSVPNVDVLRSTVTYTRTEVRVRTKYVDLRRGPLNTGSQLDVWLRLSDGGGVLVRGAASGSETFTSLYVDDTAKPGGTIHHGRCHDMDSTFDFRKNVSTVVIATSCLAGDSRSVTYHGLASAWEDDPDDPTMSRTWTDDVHDASYETEVVNRDCFWTCTGWTKVRRG